VGAKLTELTKVQAEYIGVERRPEASAQRPAVLGDGRIGIGCAMGEFSRRLRAQPRPRLTEHLEACAAA
jgi:hypothetical protein